MLAAALASRHHWRQVGEPKNFAISEWQVSRVLAVLGQGELARSFAQSGLDLCLDHDLGAFLTAYAYESLARAASVSGGDPAGFVTMAREAAAGIEDAGDREAVLRDLDSI